MRNVTEAPPVTTPTVTPVTPWTPERTPEPRPYYDPDTVREPDEICEQQKRRQGWEAV